MMSATIYPEIVPEELLADPKRKAELSVYNALRDTLPEGFFAFYSFNWIDEHRTNNREDGEADFVVAHEKFGYIVLEVKGGEISRDEKNHQWYSKGTGDKIYTIKNPVKQARESKHILLAKLKEKLGRELGFIRTKHAVIFPGSSKPKANAALGADMPLEIFMFLEDMPILGVKVFKSLLNDPLKTNTKYMPLGRSGIDALKNLYSQSFNLKPTLISKLKSCEFEIQKITEQQKKLLKQTEDNKNMLIFGGAGTGKTTLAIEKARLLEASGRIILFLCFNAPLCKYISKALKGFVKIDVYTYHQFSIKTIKAAGLDLSDTLSDSDWEEIPYMLVEALENSPDIRYDAIIIDEGQDFKKEWLDSISYCRKASSNGHFYLFYDDNQKIYQDNIESLRGISDTSFCLIENIRNSKPIFNGSKAFYAGKTLVSIGPDGFDIEWVESDEKHRDKRLEKALNRLVNNEGVSKSEIAILTAKSYKEYTQLEIGNYTFTNASELDSESIVLDSIYRFKGLEKEVVILIDLDSAIFNEHLLYVGFSRARSLLIVVDTPHTIETLRSSMPVSE